MRFSRFTRLLLLVTLVEHTASQRTPSHPTVQLALGEFHSVLSRFLLFLLKATTDSTEGHSFNCLDISSRRQPISLVVGYSSLSTPLSWNEMDHFVIPVIDELVRPIGTVSRSQDSPLKGQGCNERRRVV